jgi:hypothetical protein
MSTIRIWAMMLNNFHSDNFVVGVGVGSINLRVDPRFNQDSGAAGLLPASWEIFGSDLAH